MNLLQFILSKDFLKHLIIAVVVAIVIFSSSFIFLNIYTQHGDSFLLPDFKKMTLQEAEQIAENHGLEVEITDSVYQENWPKGTVVKQNPPPGFHVKEGRTIFLTKNATTQEMVKMPNVVGVSHRHAKAILNNSGLKIGKLIHVPDIAVNNVLKQKVNDEEVKPGKLVPKGTEVDLVVGKGSSQRTGVPDLVGLPLDQAEDKIIQDAMNVGAIRTDTTVNSKEDSLKAVVWQQYPPYGKDREIKLGTYIDLWVTVDSSKLNDANLSQIKTNPNERDSLQ
ncbi:MAG: PASTA domain-containing protein [Bacteroidales bacterium]|nr:PASTA domain-containing protein [Bacteroidales bacterium]